MATYPRYSAQYVSQQLEDGIAGRLPSGIHFRNREHEIPVSFPTFPSLNEATEAGAQNKSIQCLPLVEVSVDVVVLSAVSRTSLTQTFANFSDHWIAEANYSFPLYDGAAITSFRCTIGDEQLLEGRVKPKAQARAEYKQAVAEQRTAALLEEHTPEVFETLLGNISPKTTIKVDIEYVNELKPDIGGEGYLVTIPTSIAPRYGIPPSGYHPCSFTPTSQASLRIAVHVNAPVPIRKLESRSHPISVEMGVTGAPTQAPRFGDLAASPETGGHDPTKATATLSDRSTTLGRDFVLLVLSAGADLLAPLAMMESSLGNDESAMMVTISPRHMFSSYASMTNDFRCEIIFVADRSGSMRKDMKMVTLQDALKVCLKSLPEQCHFNIYSFGSSYSSLWKRSPGYSEETLKEAMQHVSDSFRADMGGTELLPALTKAVQQRIVGDGFTSQIILLTDGEVWNAEDTTEFVERTRKDSQDSVRFFALGIGDAVSHQLIEGIGRFGGGFGEVVTANSQGKWEGRVLRLLRGAFMVTSWNCEVELDGQPMVRVISIANADSLSYVQAPYHIPPVHSFARQSLFVLLGREHAEKLESITINTTTPSGQRLSANLAVKRSCNTWEHPTLPCRQGCNH